MLLNIIYRHFRNCGHPQLKSILDRIMHSMSIPFLFMVLKWSIEGAFMQNSKEFFVSTKASVEQGEFWKKKYFLIFDNIPYFLDSKTSILVILKL